jgi:hypothetical protein
MQRAALLAIALAAGLGWLATGPGSVTAAPVNYKIRRDCRLQARPQSRGRPGQLHGLSLG